MVLRAVGAKSEPNISRVVADLVYTKQRAPKRLDREIGKDKVDCKIAGVKEKIRWSKERTEVVLSSRFVVCLPGGRQRWSSERCQHRQSL
jgi:hypothetical protein